MSTKVTSRGSTALWLGGLGIVTVLASTPAHARNDVGRYTIGAAHAAYGAGAALLPMPVFYGAQPGPAPAMLLGEVKASRKTSAFNKSDEEACQRAFLSALKALQVAAVKLGATAIVNVRSNYENKELDSATQFECGAGAIMAGAALKGTAVRSESAGAPAPAAAAPPRAVALPPRGTAVAPAEPAAVPSPAQAQPPTKHNQADALGTLPSGTSDSDDISKARKRFEKGQRYYDLRRYAESVPEFEAAYELSGDPVLLYNLAQAYRMSEKYPDALHYYRAYLKKVPKSPRTEVVKRRIVELEATQQPPNNVDDPGQRK